MAALLTSVRDDKDKSGDLPQRVPPDEDPGAPARRQRVLRQLHPGRQRHPVRPHRDPQRRRQRRRRDRGRPRARRAATIDFNDFLEKVPALVCNKRVIESLIKAGAFDDMKHQRRALVAIHEQAVDQYVDIKRNEAIGQDSLFGGLDDTDAASASRSRSPTTSRSGTRPRLLGYERDMLGLYVSDHPLLGLEHVLSQGTDCTIGQLMLDEERPHGSTGHRQRPGHLGAAQDHQARRRAGRRSPSRTSTARSRCCCSPAPTSWPAPCSSRTPSSASRARSRATRTSPSCARQEVTVPDLSDGPSGPVVISLPSTRCTGRRRWPSSRDVLGTHPGVTEVRLRLLTRDATKVMRLDDRLRVTPSPALFADLKQLLGPGCLTG